MIFFLRRMSLPFMSCINLVFVLNKLELCPKLYGNFSSLFSTCNFTNTSSLNQGRLCFFTFINSLYQSSILSYSTFSLQNSNKRPSPLHMIKHGVHCPINKNNCGVIFNPKKKILALIPCTSPILSLH